MTWAIGEALVAAAEQADPVRGSTIYYQSLLRYRGTRIAVDVSCFLRVFGCNIDVQGRRRSEREVQARTFGNLLTAFFQFLAFLMEFDILPVLVFEGATPPMKQRERAKRDLAKSGAQKQCASLYGLLHDLEHELEVLRKTGEDAHAEKRRCVAAASASASDDARTARDAAHGSAASPPTADGRTTTPAESATSSTPSTAASAGEAGPVATTAVPTVPAVPDVSVVPAASVPPVTPPANRKRQRRTEEHVQQDIESLERTLVVHHRNFFSPPGAAYQAVKELVACMGLPFIQAEFEADWVISALYHRGIVAGGAGTDHDFLCHGTPLIRDLQHEMYDLEREWFRAVAEQGREQDQAGVHLKQQNDLAIAVTGTGAATTMGSEEDAAATAAMCSVAETTNHTATATPTTTARPIRRIRPPQLVTPERRVRLTLTSRKGKATTAVDHRVPGRIREFHPTVVARLMGFARGRSQLIDLCNLMGNDYVQEGLPGVGYIKGRKMLLEHGSVEAALAQPAWSYTKQPPSAEFRRLQADSKAVFEREDHPVDLTHPIQPYDEAALRAFAQEHAMLPRVKYGATESMSASGAAAHAPDFVYMCSLADYTHIRTGQWGRHLKALEGVARLPPMAVVPHATMATPTPDDST